jgi:adenine-specific DNA-methyltransferase
MASKRKILEAMTRTVLLDIAKHYEITGLTAKSKANIVDALAGSRKVQSDEFLTLFSRDDLKGLCQALSLAESGREKQLLIDRLMGLEAGNSNTRATNNDTRQAMAKKKTKTDVDGLNVEDYRHSGAKRKNNPPAKIAAEGTVPAVPKIEYSYSPRRPPVLRFDTSGKADKLPELLEKATKGPLTKEEAQILAEALRTQQPWLEWAGKQETESKGFSVDPVALHIHERISSQAILKVAARQDVARTLFSDPEQEYHEAVQFYKHDVQWTNRLILGDSAQVMASLAHREDLAGKVQMIYIDPPYGIRYGSNFMPEVGKKPDGTRDKENELTREPEMVRAYRDTWTLGIHSYIAYLRDRLLTAKQLLSPSGSIFVQISDENLHRVRQLMEEVFGPENFAAIIAYRTRSPLGSSGIPKANDFLIWFFNNAEQAWFHRIYVYKTPEDDAYFDTLEMPDGSLRKLIESERKDATLLPKNGLVLSQQGMLSSGATASCIFEYQLHGRKFFPGGGRSWRTNPVGIERLRQSERLIPLKTAIRFKQYLNDFCLKERSTLWMDTFTATDKEYVVQTDPEVILRCVAMTTKPGDLVVDPTCGGGTTAWACENMGRRWITIDTSRVAVAIARQRLLTSQFDYFNLRDEEAGIVGGLVYHAVPRVTVKTIAQNQNLDPIFAKHEPILDTRLNACNDALGKVTQEVRFKLDAKLMAKQQKEGKRAITDADNRRWQLPKKGERFEHWTVPFDSDPDWPKGLQQAVTEYRKAWRAKMDEVNACIAANAAQEDLVDQPEVVKGIVRVSGPFTVEAVQPPERSLGAMEGMFDGAPEELEDTFDTKNVESYLDQMTRLLKLDGVRFPNNKEMAFSRLDRLTGQAGGLHAEGRWLPKGETDDDPEGKAIVAVGFGPQYGPVTAKQVEDLIRSASRRGYDALVVAGFSFDGPAQATIEDAQHPKLRIHMASIRPDVNPGMAGLLKEQPGSQLFTVFGQPRTRLDGPNKKNEYVVHMEGVDIYDPVANTIRSTEDSKVAAWFVDGDYDGRTFCITQAFFPDRSAWDKLANALGGVLSEDAFEKLSGTVSLPFPAGKHKCVAVKVIDPRGNEVMQVHHLG